MTYVKKKKQFSCSQSLCPNQVKVTGMKRSRLYNSAKFERSHLHTNTVAQLYITLSWSWRQFNFKPPLFA